MLLGIGIFVLFSVALSLFMRLDAGHFPKTPLPENLGQWSRAQAADADAQGAGRETRLLVRRGNLLRAHALVEQVRYREADGSIGRVEPEKVVRTWRW